MQKADLKPAHLMLVQCHYEVAKKHEKEPGEVSNAVSNEHFVSLVDWLRQTYGSNESLLHAIKGERISKAEALNSFNALNSVRRCIA